MDISAIGAASIGMSLAKTQQAVGTEILKKAMDLQGSEAAALIESLQAANPAPPSGHVLDMLV